MYQRTIAEQFGVSKLNENDSTRLNHIYKTELASKVVKEALASDGKPDFADVVNAPIELTDDDEDWLVRGVIRPGTNTGFIAPTNSGGSTFLVNMAHSFLTGDHFLNRYQTLTTPENSQVVFINPEEANGTPRQRIAQLGLGRDPRFIEVHTQDKRLYLNDPLHVEAIVEAVVPQIDPDMDVYLFVDGGDKTIRGEYWNDPFEDWKNGYGQLKLAIGASVGVVRVQVTGTAARNAKRYGTSVEMEDAKGAQFAEWPDQRLIYGYPTMEVETKNGKSKVVADTSRRNLEIRGRRVEHHKGIILVFDEDTGRVEVETQLKQTTVGLIELPYLHRDEELLTAIESGDALLSKNGLASWLASRSKEQAKHDDEAVSVSTYRRAISDELLTLISETMSNRGGEQ